MMYEFVKESNRIEGIVREPTKEEILVSKVFMSFETITVEDVCGFVGICQPGARLRDKLGMDVRVRETNHAPEHVAPRGGPEIRERLENLLANAMLSSNRATAYDLHHAYESLHPFTDCNGRSGRIIWAWQMKDFPLGFLHHWYYQSLQEGE